MCAGGNDMAVAHAAAERATGKIFLTRGRDTARGSAVRFQNLGDFYRSPVVARHAGTASTMAAPVDQMRNRIRIVRPLQPVLRGRRFSTAQGNPHQ